MKIIQRESGLRLKALARAVAEFGLHDDGSGEKIALMRAYADSPVCPDCGKIPKRYQFDSRWLCGCEGRTWPRILSKRGDAEEHTKLTMAGFVMRTDNLGDTCYFDSSGHVIYLYENATWRSEPDTELRDLDGYLEHITASAA